MRIQSDWSDVERELFRLENLPGRETRLRLDATLALTFQQTQADVDVITGSLKASGKVDSRMIGDEWHGEISYGGAAPGAVKPYVRYARYEKRRGGGHDFFRSVHLTNELFRQAIVDGLQG